MSISPLYLCEYCPYNIFSCMNLVQIYMRFFIDNIPTKHEFESYFLISFGELYLANQLNNLNKKFYSYL